MYKTIKITTMIQHQQMVPSSTGDANYHQPLKVLQNNISFISPNSVIMRPVKQMGGNQPFCLSNIPGIPQSHLDFDRVTFEGRGRKWPHYQNVRNKVPELCCSSSSGGTCTRVYIPLSLFSIGEHQTTPCLQACTLQTAAMWLIWNISRPGSLFPEDTLWIPQAFARKTPCLSRIFSS